MVVRSAGSSDLVQLLTDGETEAQRVKVSCPEVAGLDSMLAGCLDLLTSTVID